jgi:hypothetical protein
MQLGTEVDRLIQVGDLWTGVDRQIQPGKFEKVGKLGTG